MPSSTSSSDAAGTGESLFVRDVPPLRWRAAGLLTLVLVLIAVAGWELWMRSLGLRTVDLDDSKPSWAAERRKVDAGPRDSIVLIGDSRILFDTSLDVWQQVAGARPLQLALAGSSGMPVLQHLAEDEHFAGLVVLGVADGMYLIPGCVAAAETTLAYARTQSPSQRLGHRIDQWLQRRLAFLDAGYALFALIDELNIPSRPGAGGPGGPHGYLQPWKLSETYSDREMALWPRFEADPWLIQHEILAWANGMERAVDFHTRNGSFLPDDMVDSAFTATRLAVEKIRSRGGEVVFLRPPSSGYFLQAERILFPRASIWDRLLRETHSFGIHFEDYPEMQALVPVEESHLRAADREPFTRAYVSVLCRNVPWLQAHGAHCNGDARADASTP